MLEGIVTLPKTPTRRGAVSSLVLARRVNLDPAVPGCLAWEGPYYRAGRTIPIESLYMGDVGGAPIALETTEAVDPCYRGSRRRWACMLVLWRFELSMKTWIEVSRVMAPASHGSMELRQLAARILNQDPWREAESIEEAAGRIHTLLYGELGQIREHRVSVTELVLQLLVSEVLLELGAIPSLRPSGRKAA